MSKMKEEAEARARRNRREASKASEQPKFSYAQLADMINKSKTTDDLDVAESCIAGLPQDQIKELRSLAENKRLSLEGNLPEAEEHPASLVAPDQEAEQPSTTSPDAPSTVEPPTNPESFSNSRELATEPEKKPPTLREKLVGITAKLQTLLPQHITPERFMRLVFMALQKVPALYECEHSSLFNAINQGAEWGLLPDGRQGALIPFKNNKKNPITGQWESHMEATFLPMYQGLIQLARNSGQIANIFPATIYENDHFDYRLGMDPTLEHVPKIDGDRGKPLMYYCIIELKDGTKTFGPGPMTVTEVEKIRQRSKSPDSPAWKNDFEAMAWKTVIKRNLKFAPSSPEMAEAIMQDNLQEYGEEIDMGNVDFVDENDISNVAELNAQIAGKK